MFNLGISLEHPHTHLLGSHLASYRREREPCASQIALSGTEKNPNVTDFLVDASRCLGRDLHDCIMFLHTKTSRVPEPEI